jgi:hypothetical protein
VLASQQHREHQNQRLCGKELSPQLLALRQRTDNSNVATSDSLKIGKTVVVTLLG